jgi:hypothetical protein
MLVTCSLRLDPERVSNLTDDCEGCRTDDEASDNGFRW